jgi:subtilisin family serine protease
MVTNSRSIGGVVSVGAVDQTDLAAEFSTFNRAVDLSAPGVETLSTLPVGFDPAGDYQRLSGTSMAAPHIAGAAALIREAGVTNPLAIKALLINTADNTGWRADTGWGYANLSRAYQQMNYFTSGLGAGQSRFWRGSISSTGFWATLVWNRHVDQNFLNPALNPLEIHLYNRSTDAELSTPDNTAQNVKQAYAAVTANAALKVKTPSGSFVGGVTTESFALALSQSGFVAASGPSLSLSCGAPGNVMPGATFTLTCTASNNGDLEAYAVTGSLNTPSGFSGNAIRALGVINPSSTATASWTLTAPSSSGGYSVQATASSSSFAFRLSCGVHATKCLRALR